MDAEELKARGDRAQHLTALRKTSGWADLKELHAERKAKVESEWLRSLRDGSHPRNLSYERGFLAGIDYIINAVDHADRTFENALKRHLKGQVKDVG